MRIACLLVADFPLAVCYRGDPDLQGALLAVTCGEGARAKVVACSPGAVEYGVHPGLTSAQARAVCDSIVFCRESEEAAGAAQNALCDVACSFSPRVEDAGRGEVYLEISGSEALYGAENELVRALIERAAQVGFAASAAVASTKVAARLAARGGCGRAVVPPREEWSHLAPLPLSMLEPEPRLAQILARWGVRTLGDLGALPDAAVMTRLGVEGARLVRRARGEDEDPFVARPLPLIFAEVVDLDYGVETVEPLLFVVRPLLERLIERLRMRGLVCGDLHLSLRLANRARVERRVAVAAPCLEIKPLLTLLRLHLEAQPPPAPVEGIHLTANAEALRPTQLDLLRCNGPAPAKLAVTLSKLAALCGDDERVGTPVVADSHRPDAYAVGAFVIADGKARVFGDGGEISPRVALRALRPPRRLEVFEDRGRIDFVRPCHENGAAEFRCQGRVVTSAGPWRIRAEWWKDEPCHRDYYDVQLSDGGIYRLYFDRARGEWFVEGYYD